MEAILLIGLQATGKSTFYQQRFRDSHVRINRDMLKTAYRERCLVETCLKVSQSFVLDNTHLTPEDRSRYREAIQKAGFRWIGYYFQSVLKDALHRNNQRHGGAIDPDLGTPGAQEKLVLPTRQEGFDALFYVSLENKTHFKVEPWQDEV